MSTYVSRCFLSPQRIARIAYLSFYYSAHWLMIKNSRVFQEFSRVKNLFFQDPVPILSHGKTKLYLVISATVAANWKWVYIKYKGYDHGLFMIINPIMIRVIPVNRGAWPDLPLSNSNLSNTHSLSRSIHGILLFQTNSLALLIHLRLKIWSKYSYKIPGVFQENRKFKCFSRSFQGPWKKIFNFPGILGVVNIMDWLLNIFPLTV